MLTRAFQACLKLYLNTNVWFIFEAVMDEQTCTERVRERETFSLCCLTLPFIPVTNDLWYSHNVNICLPLKPSNWTAWHRRRIYIYIYIDVNHMFLNASTSFTTHHRLQSLKPLETFSFNFIKPNFIWQKLYNSLKPLNISILNIFSKLWCSS